MTIATLPLGRYGERWRPWLDRGVSFARRHRPLWPAALIVLVSVVAYHLTLGSLIDYLRLETPLAYLPLLPIFSLGLALITAQRYRDAKPMRDRQIDWLIGIPLLLAAFALITVVPALASTYYWTNRPDVLSLAIFVAAMVTLCYGVSWTWRLKAPLLFLVLMWPALYLHFMAGIMQAFTDATNNVLAMFVHRLLGVTVIPVANDSPQLIVHPANMAPVTISVGSACSGADSVLGFLLIGGAILTAMQGGKGRKVLWMAAGLALTFVGNLFRITSIVAIAGWGHPDFALNTYHAFIGLVVFALVMVAMVMLLGRFGLTLKDPVKGKGSAAQPAPPKPPSRRRRRLIIAGVSLVTIVLALADHSLAPYAAFEDGYGSPTVSPFGTSASAPHGYRVEPDGNYPWARQYFGPNSTYKRYLVISPKGQIAYADVVLTDDRGSLDAYNLQNCYLFHNYNIVTSEKIDVGNGVTALLLNYADSRAHQRWATVSWAWPVNNNGKPFYERVALTSNLFVGGGDADVQPSGGFHDFLISLLNMMNGGYSDPHADTAYQNADADLRAEAQLLVGKAVTGGH